MWAFLWNTHNFISLVSLLLIVFILPSQPFRTNGTFHSFFPSIEFGSTTQLSISPYFSFSAEFISGFFVALLHTSQQPSAATDCTRCENVSKNRVKEIEIRATRLEQLSKKNRSSSAMQLIISRVKICMLESTWQQVDDDILCNECLFFCSSRWINHKDSREDDGTFTRK